MGLETTGEIIVEVDRETAFKFLEIPDQLARCIPGCHDLQQVTPGTFSAVLTSEVSFMKLNFQVNVEVVKIDPPHVIQARVTGRPLGFSGQLVGTAELHFADAGESRTLIRHSSDIGLTGKLGSLGQPVFRAKSAEMSGRFAANVKAALEDHVRRKGSAEQSQQ
jgi:carbon monoxide dehydrogenase subunit G